MTAQAVSSISERSNSLRAQFTAVIFALAFLPNLSLTLVLGLGSWNLTLTLWTLGVGGLCGLIGYFLAAAMLEPLTRLRAEAVRGDFGNEAPVSDPAEVRALRSAFVGLLSRLSTEQARRGAFMATLVHDLKTPLIATGHLVRLLTGDTLSCAERQDVSEQMLSENARLLALVQQMADAHRFERDTVQLVPRLTELRPLLDALASRLNLRAAEQGLALSVMGEGRAEVDAPVLERALGNLLDNALRYATSRVELSVKAVPGGVELSVADDGPGLSQSLGSLAQPFNAQPTMIAGQQYTAGTAGLGLFIARRIAEAHGGQLRYARLPAPDTELSVTDVSVFNPPVSFHPPLSLQAHCVLTLALPEVCP